MGLTADGLGPWGQVARRAAHLTRQASRIRAVAFCGRACVLRRLAFMIGHPFPALEEMPYNPTMSKNRIIPVLGLIAMGPLLVWAQAPGVNPTSPVPAPAAPTVAQPPSGLTPAPTLPAAGAAPGLTPPDGAAATPAVEPPTEAELALDDAIKKLQALTSVSADLVQTVQMLGQRFELRGQYAKAPNYRTYLKLVLSGLGDSPGTMQQVCDGTTLWDFQQLLNDRGYQRTDIGKVLKKMDTLDLDAEIRKQVLDHFGFAGPEALLMGLRKAVRFDRKEAGELDGKQVWVLRGKWKDLQAITGSNQPPFPATAPLPPYIPSIVAVWIGQDDGWPYKTQFEGRVPSVLDVSESRQLDLNNRPIGRKSAATKVDPSHLLLVYQNVKLNPSLQSDLFFFELPPGVQPRDETDQILIRLEQTAAVIAEQKKADAAREGADVSQPIRVPGPASDTPPPIERINPPPK
jgi:outer membrane lipoprotein-sorting protein